MSKSSAEKRYHRALCWACAKPFQVAEELIRKTVLCPRCGKPNRVPDDVWADRVLKDVLEAAPPPPIELDSPTAKLPQPRFPRLRRWWPAAVIAISVPVLVYTGWRPPSPWLALNYCAVIGACIGTVALAKRRFRTWNKLVRYASVAFVALVLIANARFDRYTIRWVSDDGTKFFDTYMRWGDRHVYREMILTGGMFVRGPMAGEGKPKPHGKWVYVPADPRVAVSYDWCWYGETVTEAQWEALRRGSQVDPSVNIPSADATDVVVPSPTLPPDRTVAPVEQEVRDHADEMRILATALAMKGYQFSTGRPILDNVRLATLGMTTLTRSDWPYEFQWRLNAGVLSGTTRSFFSVEADGRGFDWALYDAADKEWIDLAMNRVPLDVWSDAQHLLYEACTILLTPDGCEQDLPEHCTGCYPGSVILEKPVGDYALQVSAHHQSEETWSRVLIWFNYVGPPR